ncbi:ferrochelatase [Pseudoflavitalea sp. X16]|uniref:ferrochelatase n=1 Tax=Paraflavitalea devenefica TaxID=2716334 RepID=UPI0014204213|nr:ferrochelatase [Paraflavitalea devenefica]NII24062.1 ferrochelatase [Paraflavitalea devenefica]
MSATKRGIVLMNLGSPDSTEVKDVRRYLDEFLMDGRVIDTPLLLRALLVKGLIVPFRAPKSAAAYRSIWTKEGSPLIVISKQLQQALQAQVEEPVALAMRYGNPAPWTAYDELLQQQPDLEEVVLVPLYPHYAMSSYETAVEYAKKIHRKGKYSFKLSVVPPFYDDPAFLEALIDSIKPYLEKEYDHIVFSYHGIPERHVHKSDVTGQHCLKADNCCAVDSEAHKTCYRHQCIVTTNRVAQALNIPASKYSFSFQSRLGRDEWLKPYTAIRLTEMPKEGIKKLLILCPAFVSDCLETLEEMGEEGREIFLHAGGEEFTLIPCLNVHPAWVSALKGLVERAV